MLYNTGLILKYNTIKDEDLSDTQYRKELAHVFNFDNFNISDFDNLDKCINKLFERLPSNNKELNTVLEKAASTFFTQDKTLGFRLLFSYQTFFLLHQFLIKYLNENTICYELLNRISNCL